MFTSKLVIGSVLSISVSRLTVSAAPREEPKTFLKNDFIDIKAGTNKQKRIWQLLSCCKYLAVQIFSKYIFRL